MDNEIPMTTIITINPLLDKALHPFAGQRCTCPHCGVEGSIETDFGCRMSRGKSRVQSWCRKCRASPQANPGGRSHR